MNEEMKNAAPEGGEIKFDNFTIEQALINADCICLLSVCNLLNKNPAPDRAAAETAAILADAAAVLENAMRGNVQPLFVDMTAHLHQKGNQQSDETAF